MERAEDESSGNLPATWDVTRNCVCILPSPAKKESRTRLFAAANLIDCQVHEKSRYISDVTRANLDCAFANTNESTIRRLGDHVCVRRRRAYDRTTNATTRIAAARERILYAAAIRGSSENGTAILTRSLSPSERWNDNDFKLCDRSLHPQISILHLERRSYAMCVFNICLAIAKWCYIACKSYFRHSSHITLLIIICINYIYIYISCYRDISRFIERIKIHRGEQWRDNKRALRNRRCSTKSIKFIERRQDPLRTPDDKLVWN